MKKRNSQSRVGKAVLSIVRDELKAARGTIMQEYSDSDVQHLLSCALGSALVRISETLQQPNAMPAHLQMAYQALGQLATALAKQKPAGNGDNLPGSATPTQVREAIADLVHEHDGPELRRMLAERQA